LPIKNKTILLLIFAAALFLSSCSNYKKQALGPDEMIVVLADETIYDTHLPQLQTLYSRPVYTPMKEELYYLKRISLEEFENEGYSRYKNIIMLSNIDSNTPETNFIKKMISAGIQEGVRNGEYYYALKSDAWSKGQTILFLLDSKNVHLGGYLERFNEKMFNVFYEKMITGIKKRLFDKYSNDYARDYLNKNYGIDMFIPHDFAIGEQGKGNDKFIRFRRTNPDRWMTVLRTQYNSELSFQENIIQTRDRIGREFADSVRVNPEILSFKPDSTFVQDGIKAEGIWEYIDGGGPFFTYAFIKSGNFYLIDGAVFAPSKDKYPFLIQLDLMAKTAKFPETAE